MKYVASLLVAVCCFSFTENARAQNARVPEIAFIEITNDKIWFQFEWIGEDPAFEPDEAVEFEVIIVTDNPKCFAQPPTGRDDDFRRIPNNFPASHDLTWGYTDVWNYWEPPRSERISEIEKYCGSIGAGCAAGLWTVPIADDHANFAVGTINPHLFRAGPRYWFFYPLQSVNRPECQDRENRLAWVQINMTTFPNTCSLCQNPTNCVHLIGLETSYGIKCPEITDETRVRKSLIKRLCVNGDNTTDGSYTFSPDPDIAGGGACYDDDEDTYFALQRVNSPSPLPMFGHRVGDCNDDPDDPAAASIHNEFYDSEAGICHPGTEDNCTNEVDDDFDGLTDCHDPDCALDPDCIIGCTPICMIGDTQCGGNTVERCAQNECEFEYWYSCNANEICVNGSCILQTDPAPVISNVSCDTYFRGEQATCTIQGNNFQAGGNTYIEDLENRNIISLNSTQIVVEGLWDCINPLGFKQVSHVNPDSQRDDTYNLVETIMGELMIFSYYQTSVNLSDTNIPMGFVGCNFGPTPSLWTEGISLSNQQMLAEDHVRAYGTITNAPGTYDRCIAKYPGATSSFDKKCEYNSLTILP